MDACVKILDGSGFFAAEHFILTCSHVLKDENTKIGNTIKYFWNGVEHKAVVDEICKEKDLALLYTETPPDGYAYLRLDRLAIAGTEARLYGYPNENKAQKNTCVRIGAEDGAGMICLDSANNVTQGYSGGPLISTTEDGVAVGICAYIHRPDRNLRGIDAAGMIPAGTALELWGKKLEELRYIVAPDKRNPFVYNSLKTDFSDPGNKLGQLQDFISCGRSICWWSVVGEGGSGKSRLAYELAHSLTSIWRCHLLSPDQLTVEKLDRLCASPGRRHLLIANYAYTNTGGLGDWLDSVIAAAQENRSSRYIRVLLLQRKGKDDPYAPWRESLLCGHRTLEEYRYRDKDLAIERPGKRQLTDIMRSYAASRSREVDKNTCNSLYRALETVDASFTRPLFAMFITDAFLDGNDPFVWDAEAALNHFCWKEQAILDRAVGSRMAYAAKALWVLATISHGYSLSPHSLPNVALRGRNSVSPSTLGCALADAGFAKEEEDSWIIDPMTPDLLGEYFVLKHFEDNRDRISGILSTALTESPLAVSDFLTRLFTDYPVDIEITKACCQGDRRLALAVSCGLVRYPDPDALKTLYETYQTDFWLAQYAKGLFNLFNHQVHTKDAMETLERIRVLYEEKSKNTDVVTQYANALFNHFNRQTVPECADEVLKQLRMVYEKSEDIAKAVVVPYMKGIVNFIDKGYLPERADDAFEELCRVYKENQTNSEVVAWYAKGIFCSFNKQAEPERALETLELLHLLYKDHRENTETAVRYAWALFNLFNRQTEPERSETLARLCALYEDTLHNTRVATQYAWALFNHFCDQTDLKRADEILEQLRKLCDENPGNGSVAVQYAKGLFHHFNPLTEPERADKLLLQLRKLSKTYSSVGGVVTRYANGLFDHICAQTEPKPADKSIKQLRELYEENPSNIEVAALYAKGLYARFSRQNEPKRADTFLKQLRKLSADNTDNGEIIVWHAKALNAFLMTHAKDKEKGKVILMELRDLAEMREEAQAYYITGRQVFGLKYGWRM